MGDLQDDKRWWQTLPGLLSALVVIAVTGGVVALLIQFRILGSKGDDVRAADAPRPAPPAAVATNLSTGAPSAFANPIPPIGKRTWSETEAVIQTRDGMVNRLQAASFGSCIATAHQLSLDNGQSIPFERMAGFEVFHSDPPTSPDGKARLLVEMLDGKKVQATVASACELFGESMEGRFSGHFEAIRSVHFER